MSDGDNFDPGDDVCDHESEVEPEVARGLFADVAAEEDIADGAILGVRVDGRALVLARAAGRLHAVGGVCTHASVLLEQGWLTGTTLHCPLHEAGFDLVTGAVVAPPACRGLPTFEVRVESGRVLVARSPKVP